MTNGEGYAKRFVRAEWIGNVSDHIEQVEWKPRNAEDECNRYQQNVGLARPPLESTAQPGQLGRALASHGTRAQLHAQSRVDHGHDGDGQHVLDEHGEHGVVAAAMADWPLFHAKFDWIQCFVA